ncbi:LysM peptidoglycan-binding domain-containing protein [Enterococcus wangshanyuanii]|uniref:N-acetylmuramidase n=1 Tax=Enterococcus wangshanyuanii TaxID=2005703 RepID=A0ABQ1P552_9ENTE|nr:LysM domain-containing protein [Enterococcus wangshanyuanii]GGC89293.1 N-acetylmuramidase [Enterococcus wangshanyuanii]
MEEEYSRRKQTRPASTPKSWMIIVILLLFINTLALGSLLFMNMQENTKNEERFNNIEKKVSQLDQETNKQTPVSEETEQNVLTRPSSTQESQTEQSSSTTVDSTHTADQTTPSSETTTHVAEPAATTYTVQSGDTLSVIAEKNNISLQDLMAKNNLTDATVYIGQVLSLQ